MADGPGKYDDLATLVRERAQARGVIVIVIDGTKGSGFEVHGDAELQASLPSVLRRVADEIERSQKRGSS